MSGAATSQADEGQPRPSSEITRAVVDALVDPRRYRYGGPAWLLRLIWRERVELRDGMIRLDATPAGPRRYRVHAGGRPVGAGKGCSVDMYLLALALGRPIHAESRRLVDRLEATPPATPTP